MNLLYDPLPEAVLVAGHAYRIYTDYRDWMRFFAMQEDASGTPRQKLLLSLDWYKERPPIQYLEASIQALMQFAQREQYKRQTEARHTSERLLDWSYDAPYLYAAFLSVYRLDLIRVEHLHWHVFLAMLDGLPDDTPIKQRMQYRSVNLAAVKDPQERRRIAAIQDKIRIPGGELDAFQCGAFFG